jgi:arginase
MFPPMANPIPGKNICMIGLRSVDPGRARGAGADRQSISPVMRHIDDTGSGRRSPTSWPA